MADSTDAVFVWDTGDLVDPADVEEIALLLCQYIDRRNGHPGMTKPELLETCPSPRLRRVLETELDFADELFDLLGSSNTKEEDRATEVGPWRPDPNLPAC